MGTRDRAGKSPLAASAAGDYQILMAIARERVAPATPTADGAAIEWRTSAGLMPYADAVAAMEARVAAIRGGTAPELVWLVEHPPLYTAGGGAPAAAPLQPRLFPGPPPRRGRPQTPQP